MFGKRKKKEVEVTQEVESVSVPDVGEVESTEPEIEEKRERLLYMVMDKEIPGAAEYMRGLGLDIYGVYTSVDDVRDPLLMATEASRLVIVETGTGALTSTKSREQLIDIIGMQDEDTAITVFYTDDTIKRDAQKHLGKGAKGVEWVAFRSTLDVVAHIMKYGDTYILDEYCQTEVKETEEEIKKFRGQFHEMIGEDPKVKVDREDLKLLVSEEFDGLVTYEVSL